MGKKTAAALLAASALLVAACGDDAETETGGEDVEEPGATEDTEADDEGEAAGGDFCDEYADFSQNWGIDDIHDDPAGYGAALGELEPAPEIAEDVQTLLDSIEAVIDALGATTDDSGHDSEAHDDLGQAMEPQELQKTIQEVKDADDAITGWVENNCAT